MVISRMVRLAEERSSHCSIGIGEKGGQAVEIIYEVDILLDLTGCR